MIFFRKLDGRPSVDFRNVFAKYSRLSSVGAGPGPLDGPHAVQIEYDQLVLLQVLLERD